MRIGLLANTLDGGVGVHAFHLARTLLGRGHAVTVVGLRGATFSEPMPATRTLIPDGAYMAGPDLDTAGLITMAQWIRARRWDVVVLAKGGMGAGNLRLDLAARLGARRFVTVEHQAPVPLERGSRRHFGGLVPGIGLHWRRRRMAGRLRSLAPHRIVAVGQTIRARLCDDYGYSLAKVTVIQNGVDPTRFRDDPELRAEARRAWGVPPDAVVLGAVGRLARIKGYDFAIRAFAALGAAAGPARLVLVGTGPDRDALGALAAELGVADRIHLPGHTDASWAALNGLDVFVLSSRWEGLSYGLLEAMACARPVVAFEVAGVPEVLDGVRAGWRVPHGDVDRLAEAFRAAVAAPPDDRAAMGRAGRAVILERFAMDRQMARLAEVIETA